MFRLRLSSGVASDRSTFSIKDESLSLTAKSLMLMQAFTEQRLHGGVARVSGKFLQVIRL